MTEEDTPPFKSDCGGQKCREQARTGRKTTASARGRRRAQTSNTPLTHHLLVCGCGLLGCVVLLPHIVCVRVCPCVCVRGERGAVEASETPVCPRALHIVARRAKAMTARFVQVVLVLLALVCGARAALPASCDALRRSCPVPVDLGEKH